MNVNSSCLPDPIALHSPWLLRLVMDLRQRWFRRRRARTPAEIDYRALAHLSEDTLRDIGAPDWMHAGDRELTLWMIERGRR